MNQHSQQPNRQILSNEQKLTKKVQELQAENKRLKARIADLQPYKQKQLRPPNQQKIHELFQKYELRKFAFKVCYLGFNYDGMAYQKLNDSNTIEAYIFKALHIMSLVKAPLPAEDYTRAGRTDKGVSAMGNVFSLKLRSNIPKNPQAIESTKLTKKIQYCSMLNAILPEDIRILACQQVEQDFNARYCCKKRSYKYFFARNNLNIQVMKQAIKSFIGTHNFINYCKINLTNTVNFDRTIHHAEIIKSQINQIFQTQTNQVYYFYFVANSFLWHQIRFMTSVLFLIGSGQEKPSLVSELLDLKKFPIKPNYPMAPQYPLILEDCEYPNLNLDSDLKTSVSFYKTFNEIVMKKSTEKTLIINCMMMAQRDIIKSLNITKETFLKQYSQSNQRVVNKSGKTLSMHKSSGKSLQQSKNSLKGKKKEIFEKKMTKQLEFERKQREANANNQNDGKEQQDNQNNHENKEINQIEQVDDGNADADE